MDTPATTVLLEAHDLVGGEKRDDYGSALEGMELIAELWQPILGTYVSPEMVVLCLSAMKLARATERLHNGQPIKRDTVVDLAGYAGVLDLVTQELSAREAAEDAA